MPRLGDQLHALREFLKYELRDSIAEALEAGRLRSYVLPIKGKLPRASDVTLNISKYPRERKDLSSLRYADAADKPRELRYALKERRPAQAYVTWQGQSGVEPRYVADRNEYEFTQQQKRERAAYGLKAMHAVANA